MKKFTLIFVFLLVAFSWNNAAAQGNVTFNLDTTGGGFIATDQVFITGGPWGWTTPGDDASLELLDGDADGIFSITLPLCEMFVEYRFHKNAGWDNGDQTRFLQTTGVDEAFSFVWGVIPDVVNNPLPVTFEGGYDDMRWLTFSQGPDADLCSDFSIVANPAVDGINTSANAIQFVVNDNADQWAGAWTGAYDTIKFTEEYHTLTMMVNRSTIGRSALKVESSSDGGPVIELFATNTVVDEWELLTYDFTAGIGFSYPRFVIFPDFPDAARTAGATVLLDNIAEAVMTELPYAQLYVIGDACSIGWDLQNALPMVVDGTDPTIFTWQGPLTASELKFATQVVNWDQGDEITALTAGADAATATAYQIRACGDGSCTGDDNKWMVDAAGTYLVTINLTAETIDFELQVGIKEVDAFSNVSVYPNPAYDMLNVEVGQNTGASISLFSIDGRRLYSEVATESTTRIDMSRMNASGIVIVKVENDQLSKVFRVVVK